MITISAKIFAARTFISLRRDALSPPAFFALTSLRILDHVSLTITIGNGAGAISAAFIGCFFVFLAIRRSD